MADKSLARIFFPIYRNTKNDQGQTIKDPIGVFSCNLNAARFLDLESKAIALPVISRERAGGTRSLTLADGTKLTSTTSTASAKSEILLPASGRGSRTVILKTGKLITDTQRKKNKLGAYHTISFRFPSFATILNISEALGEIIPETKIKNPPTGTDIWGYFTVKGGRRYPIMNTTVAENETTTDVPESDQEMTALAAKAGLKIRKAADGKP